jgi:hypothetical protein
MLDYEALKREAIEEAIADGCTCDVEAKVETMGHIIHVQVMHEDGCPLDPGDDDVVISSVGLLPPPSASRN